jgi:RNA-directed DNA polymerase
VPAPTTPTEESGYHRYPVRKRDGSTRWISAPSPKLKAAQRWILRNVLATLPVHDAAHGFRAGRSIATNAAAHTGARVVIELDLHAFFPTVTYPRVAGVFRRAGYPEPLTELLALACTECVDGARRLPQGAPTSPALTNALCLQLDRRLAGLAARHGWRYTRYADDLTFSLPETHEGEPKIGPLMSSIGRIVKEEGFRVHPRKTRITRNDSRQKVTGLVVNGAGAPRVPRALRQQLRAAVHNLSRGKPLPPGETLARLTGRVAFINMTDRQLGAKLRAELAVLTAATTC